MNLRPLPLAASVTSPADADAIGALRVPSPAQWMEGSACQYTDPEVFFPDKGESSLPARRICYRCPVVSQCLQWALTTGEPHGVLGGQSVHDRRALAAAMRDWAHDAQLTCPSRGPVPPEVQQAYLSANAAAVAA